MQGLSPAPDSFDTATYSASELSALFTKDIPEGKIGSYFTAAGSSYLQAIATYFNSKTDRLDCTLAHVTAMVQYPDYKAILGLMISNVFARPYVEHLRCALEQGAEGQVGMVVIQLQLLFAHLTPGREATERIQGLVQQDLVA